MDPNTTAAIMRDESADVDDRRQACRDLAAWLSSGGFPQTIPGRDGKPRSFGGNTAARLAARLEVDRYTANLAPLVTS